jgi:hypothetical protein
MLTHNSIVTIGEYKSLAKCRGATVSLPLGLDTLGRRVTNVHLLGPRAQRQGRATQTELQRLSITVQPGKLRRVHWTQSNFRISFTGAHQLRRNEPDEHLIMGSTLYSSQESPDRHRTSYALLTPW